MGVVIVTLISFLYLHTRLCRFAWLVRTLLFHEQNKIRKDVTCARILALKELQHLP